MKDLKYLTPEVRKIYIRAFWYSVQRSISDFVPVHIHGLLDFNLHKWIFKLKQNGKDLPMPEGVVEAIKQNEVTCHNSRRTVGSALKCVLDGIIYVGVVKKQIGEEGLLIEARFSLTPVKSRYKFKELNPSLITLKKEDYKATGSVYTWLNRNIGKIDPIVSLHRLTRIIKSM